MPEIKYDRNKVLLYAKKWALSRNPNYLNFNNLGGDCTNFVSQCIYAGCATMNYTPTTGWYYINAKKRTASWTGVEYLYNFLITNKGVGPAAVLSSRNLLDIGDIIQLGNRNGVFYHSSVITGISQNDILVSTHTFDAYMRPLSTYKYENIRYLHILN